MKKKLLEFRIKFLDGNILFLIIYFGFFIGCEISMQNYYFDKLFEQIFDFFPLCFIILIIIIDLSKSKVIGLLFIVLSYLIIKQKQPVILNYFVYFFTCIFMGFYCYKLLLKLVGGS